MPLFFVSTVMATLPVYTTSKLHAARINLRQTPSSTPGVLFNYVKGRGLAGSGRGLQGFFFSPRPRKRAWP